MFSFIGEGANVNITNAFATSSVANYVTEGSKLTLDNVHYTTESAVTNGTFEGNATRTAAAAFNNSATFNQIIKENKVADTISLVVNSALGTNNVSTGITVETIFGAEASGVLKVSNAQQLKEAMLLGAEDASIEIVLAENIDLSGWETISNFKGTINGNGKTITGLTTALVDNFEGKVSDLNISNVAITGGADDTSVGALANSANNATITNVSVSGTVNSGSSTGAVGAIVGTATNTLFKIVSSSASVTSSNSFTGGIVGKMTGGSIVGANTSGAITASNQAGGIAGIIENASISSAKATGNVSGGMTVGGLVGGATNNSQISNSLATGDVISDTMGFAGGLVGALLDSTLDTVRAEGNVTGALMIGGLVGNATGTFENGEFSTIIHNAYASGNISASQGGGLVGNIENVQITNSIAKGSVMGGGASNSGLGGFAGNASGNFVISNSYSSGSIFVADALSNGGHGGFIGMISGQAGNTQTIENAFAQGTVSSSNGIAGGFIGSVEVAGTDFTLKNYAFIGKNEGIGAIAINGVSYAIVSTGEELLSALQNNQNVMLQNDIDLTGIAWEDIVDYSGIFDGAGHIISNLIYSGGLFASTNGATIQNLALENLNITSDSLGYIGGLVDDASSSTITNVHVNNSSITNNQGSAGGLVGYNNEGTIISNSSFSGSVTGSSDTGGIIAFAGSGSSVSNVYSTGTITGGGKTGGIVGYSNVAYMDNLYSTCEVTGNGETGGIVGYDEKYTSITSSYFAGSVSSTSGSVVGAILGRKNEDTTLADCYYNTECGATDENASASSIAEMQSGIDTINASIQSVQSDLNTITISEDGGKSLEWFKNIENVTSILNADSTSAPDKVAAAKETWKINVLSAHTSTETASADSVAAIVDGYALVRSAAQLQNALSAGNNVMLMQDIDLKNFNWSQIADYTGTINGNGFTISNISESLFTNLTNATVKELTLKNVTTENALAHSSVGGTI